MNSNDHHRSSSASVDGGTSPYETDNLLQQCDHLPEGRGNNLSVDVVNVLLVFGEDYFLKDIYNGLIRDIKKNNYLLFEYQRVGNNPQK